MSSAPVPQVPPRPSRSPGPKQPSEPGSKLGDDIPKIPPRPQRRIERSASPSRFASSPLNEPTFVARRQPSSGGLDAPAFDRPKRPSSIVNMPSVGQEGMEYADISTPEPQPDAAVQTRNIAEDLKLHAPKASLSKSSATDRIATVTRTDSNQAAAFGIGRAKGDDTPYDSSRPQSLRTKPSFTGSHNGSERAAHPHDADDEHQPDEGEVGQRVPMYPNAGLVQAPSKSSHTPQFTPGIGFHNDGSKRHHSRRSSARGFEGPPGSYGMHGHGILPKDKMEQAYYEKHPELWKKEVVAHHGEDRKDWAMSSEDLNKIVRQTASRGSGLGRFRMHLSYSNRWLTSFRNIPCYCWYPDRADRLRSHRRVYLANVVAETVPSRPPHQGTIECF